MRGMTSRSSGGCRLRHDRPGRPLIAAQAAKAPARRRPGPPAGRRGRSGIQRGAAARRSAGWHDGGQRAGGGEEGAGRHEGFPAVQELPAARHGVDAGVQQQCALDAAVERAGESGVRAQSQRSSLRRQAPTAAAESVVHAERGRVGRRGAGIRGADVAQPDDRASGNRSPISNRVLRRSTASPTVAEKQLERVTDPAERRDAQTRRREERVAMLQAAGRRPRTAEADARASRSERWRGSMQDLEGRKVQLADLEARRKALEDNLQSLKSRYDSAHPQIVQLQSELDRLSVQVAAAREGARPPSHRDAGSSIPASAWTSARRSSSARRGSAAATRRSSRC